MSSRHRKRSRSPRGKRRSRSPARGGRRSRSPSHHHHKQTTSSKIKYLPSGYYRVKKGPGVRKPVKRVAGPFNDYDPVDTLSGYFTDQRLLNSILMDDEAYNPYLDQFHPLYDPLYGYLYRTQYRLSSKKGLSLYRPDPSRGPNLDTVISNLTVMNLDGWDKLTQSSKSIIYYIHQGDSTDANLMKKATDKGVPVLTVIAIPCPLGICTKITDTASIVHLYYSGNSWIPSLNSGKYLTIQNFANVSRA